MSTPVRHSSPTRGPSPGSGHGKLQKTLRKIRSVPSLFNINPATQNTKADTPAVPAIPTSFSGLAQDNTTSKPPVTPQRTRAGTAYYSISPASGESPVSVPDFPLPPSSQQNNQSIRHLPHGPLPHRPPPLTPTEYSPTTPSRLRQPIRHCRQPALDQRSLRRIQSNVNLRTYEQETSAYQDLFPDEIGHATYAPLPVPTRGSSRHHLAHPPLKMSYSPAHREYLAAVGEGSQSHHRETSIGLIDEAADQSQRRGSESESIASITGKGKGKAVNKNLGRLIAETTDKGPFQSQQGENVVVGRARNVGSGKAAGVSMGPAPAESSGRPDTQDSSTLVASTHQSRSFIESSPGQADPQRGTITATITAGPSGRPNIFEDKIKRLKKWFQGEPSRFDGYDTDSSDLDPAMTCRGLPDDGILVSKEVTVASGPANPAPSSDPQAPETFLSRFKTEKFVKSNGEILDSNDESLQRYKQSLGLGGGKDLSDPNAPRVCIIHALTMETPGRDPVTIDLSKPGSEATLKDQPFKIKEGSKFTMVVTFKVQHEILSGLQYVQVVKRKGIKVGKDSEMLVSDLPTYSFHHLREYG